MSPVETSAIIAGGVSLISAFATYYTTKWKTSKELDGVFASRLHDLRLSEYPRAFNLTESLGKRYELSHEDATTKWLEMIAELRTWKGGVASLVMSEQSLDWYYKLNEALKATPAKGSYFNEQQVERIFNARTQFRLSLRKDIGLKKENQK